MRKQYIVSTYDFYGLSAEDINKYADEWGYMTTAIAKQLYQDLKMEPERKSFSTESEANAYAQAQKVSFVSLRTGYAGTYVRVDEVTMDNAGRIKEQKWISSQKAAFEWDDYQARYIPKELSLEDSFNNLLANGRLFDQRQTVLLNGLYYYYDDVYNAIKKQLEDDASDPEIIGAVQAWMKNIESQYSDIQSAQSVMKKYEITCCDWPEGIYLSNIDPNDFADYMVKHDDHLHIGKDKQGRKHYFWDAGTSFPRHNHWLQMNIEYYLDEAKVLPQDAVQNWVEDYLPELNARGHVISIVYENQYYYPYRYILMLEKWLPVHDKYTPEWFVRHDRDDVVNWMCEKDFVEYDPA